jgi:pyridoxamine 5'-phosphate oxidase
MNNLSHLRRDYSGSPLDSNRMAADPFAQFGAWLDEAIAAGLPEPNAMTLATVNEHGAPSCRVVLLKEFSTDGFVFFTNYLSRKGREIGANPQVALLFFQGELQRQIRISGTAEKISTPESDAYFNSRPLRSRVAAAVSQQSSVIQSREALDNNFEAELTRSEVSGISRPPHWGGYRVVPDEFEFWQGRADRLHDRIRYVHEGNKWKRERLSP